jgi:Gluconate 2-dehydrogenase subunit 3
MSVHDPQKMIPLTPVSDESASESASGVGRRTVLQTLLGGVGAGFALPAVAQAQHPVHQHVGTATAAIAQKKAAAAAYKPVFLDAHQLKTLTSLSEAIVPGSTEAKVAPFLDTLLAVESAQNQKAFLSALGAFDMLAIEKNSKPWVALTAAEQDALLQTTSTTAPGTRPGWPGAAPATSGKTTIGDHFNNLKGWIAGAYFSSEKGARELGWTGNVFHTELPGCTHPDGHSG